MAESNNDQNNGAKKTDQSPMTDIKINFTPSTQASAGNSAFASSGGPTEAKADSSNQAKKDVFSSIGNKPANTGSSTLIENISSQKEVKGNSNIKSILGNSALLEKSLQQEQELKLKKKLRLVQTLFTIVFVAFIAVQSYLYYELSPSLNVVNLYTYTFEQNLTNKIADLNKNLRSVQTLINKYHYLSAQLYLNDFSFLSGKFIDGMAKLNSTDEAIAASIDKTTLLAEIEENKIKLPQLLTKIKNNLTASIVVETYPTTAEEKLTTDEIETNFQNELRLALNADKKDLLKSSTEAKTSEQLEGAKFIDNAIKLVGNQKLMTALKAISTESFQKDLDTYQKDEDAANRKKVRDYVATLLESTKIDLATVSAIKNNRIEWSSIIDRIKTITDTVNNDHNAATNNVSKFVYSGYEFNANANKIILSGMNTTQSGTNTSVMSNLIDSFETSPFFVNVANRSFPKAKSVSPDGDTVYMMNFKIDLGLEKEDFSAQNAPIALQTASLKTGKKRVLDNPVKTNLNPVAPAAAQLTTKK